MKKLFLWSFAALSFAACTSEENPMAEEEISSKKDFNLVEVPSISRCIGGGEMVIEPEYDDVGVPTCRQCCADLVIGLGFNYDYVVIADDFAIQNGDKLYMNASIGEDHSGVTNGFGEGQYVHIDDNNYTMKGHPKLHLRVVNICDLYNSYVGKYDENQVPFINESGELTLVVYLWPGKLDEEGNFSSIFLGEGYIIGNENGPEERSNDSDMFNLKVSLYKGVQGSLYQESNANTICVKEGWSYVKASIHISPKK